MPPWIHSRVEQLVARLVHIQEAVGSSPSPATKILSVGAIPTSVTMQDKGINNNIETLLSDALIGRPVPFECGGKFFYIYPLTLGKSLLCARLIQALEINNETISKSLYAEALRLATQKKDICLELIAYHTCKDKDEVFNFPLIEERKALFKEETTTEDIASLLLVLLTQEKTETFMKHLGIDKEQQRMREVMRKKGEDKSSISFGGKSIYGTLIDAACERYGWTYDYCMWGISYNNLRLLLADKINSVYLTDKERKNVPANLLQGSENAIKGDDPANKERIHQMNWH